MIIRQGRKSRTDRLVSGGVALQIPQIGLGRALRSRAICALQRFQHGNVVRQHRRSSLFEPGFTGNRNDVTHQRGPSNFTLAGRLQSDVTAAAADHRVGQILRHGDQIHVLDEIGAFCSTSKIRAVDQLNSSAPFIAANRVK